jgi:hypothetical protein
VPAVGIFSLFARVMMGNVLPPHLLISKNLFPLISERVTKKKSHFSFKFNSLGDNSGIEMKEADDFPNAL